MKKVKIQYTSKLRKKNALKPLKAESVQSCIRCGTAVVDAQPGVPALCDSCKNK